MRFLLDTHPFIWYINGDAELPEKPKNIITNYKNECYLSIACIWEIAIKTSLGKLKLKSNFKRIETFLFENNIKILHIGFEHLQTLLTLEYYHRDPFDRIIIAQGIAENMTVLSKDTIFEEYPVRLIWK